MERQYNLPLSEAGMLMEKKHERVLVAVQRLFVARRFCLHTLKEMRLSKLKVLSQTDFRALLMADPGPDQSCVSSALKVGAWTRRDESEKLFNNVPMKTCADVHIGPSFLCHDNRGAVPV